MLYIIFDGLKLTIKIKQSANDNIADKSQHKVLRVAGSFFMVKPAGFFNTPLDSEQNKRIKERIVKEGESKTVHVLASDRTDVESRLKRVIDPDKLLTVKEQAKNLAGLEEPHELIAGRMVLLREYASYKILTENCPAASTICGFSTKTNSSDLLYVSSNRVELEELITRSKSLETDSVYSYKRWEWCHTRNPKNFIAFLLESISTKDELTLLDNNGFQLGYTAYDDKIEADLASHEIMELSVYAEPEAQTEIEIESEVDHFNEAVQNAYRACVINNYENFKNACSSMQSDLQEFLSSVSKKINALKLPNKKLSANFASFSTKFAAETVKSELTIKLG
jgi:hypothetical protein